MKTFGEWARALEKEMGESGPATIAANEPDIADLPLNSHVGALAKSICIMALPLANTIAEFEPGISDEIWDNIVRHALEIALFG